MNEQKILRTEKNIFVESNHNHFCHIEVEGLEVIYPEVFSRRMQTRSVLVFFFFYINPRESKKKSLLVLEAEFPIRTRNARPHRPHSYTCSLHA